MKTKQIKIILNLAVAVAILAMGRVTAATPYPMASGDYAEHFDDIADWGVDFSSGTGAQYWGTVGANATGTIPDGQKTTYSTLGNSPTSSGVSTGCQRGTGAMLFLTSGTGDNTNALAVDLFLDFTGRTGGNLSFDWAEVNNSSGNRGATLRIYTSTDGSTWTELTAARVVVTNGIAASGTVSTVALPAGFSGSTTARIRFYAHNGPSGGPGTPTSSRPKISLDNVIVAGTGGTVNPPNISDVSPSSFTTNAGGSAKFTVTATGDALNYFWFKQSNTSSNFISGATNVALTLSNVVAADATNYWVVVSNSANRAVGGPVSLFVNDPAIQKQPVVSQTRFPGQAVSFSVVAAGTGLTYQWKVGDPGSGTPVTPATRITGINSNTLTISNLVYGDTSDYYVTVSNSFGSSLDSSAATLIVSNVATVTEWDFNGTFDTSTPAPSYGSGSASLLASISGASTSGSSNDTANAASEGLANNSWNLGGFPTNGNSANNKTAGPAFNVSTLGMRNVIITYDARNSSTASKYIRFQYTTNGTDFTDYPAANVFVNPPASESQTNDLTGFPGVRNNPNFRFRIVNEYEDSANFGVGTNAYVAANGTYNAGAGTIHYDIVTVVASAITNGNQSPVISGLSDTTVSSSSPASPVNLNFTVTDPETVSSGGSLVVTAVSENQLLLPSSSIGLSGDGTNRVLTVTPTLDSTGFSPIIVTVSDPDGNSTATIFNITLSTNAVVLPPPSPSISKIARTTDGIVLSGTNNNGNTAGNYAVLFSTNLTLPLGSWTPVITQAYNPDGTFGYTNPPSTDARRFFILQAMP